MYEHGSAVLAKSSSYSRLLHESDHGVGSRTEKTGELDADIKPKGKKNILVYQDALYNMHIYIWVGKAQSLWYVQH